MTMLACMAAFQGLIGQAARGGHAFESDGVIAAIVPGLSELAIANATVYRDPTRLAAALPQLETAYQDAGVGRSMVWVPPDDDVAPAVLREAGYALDSEAPAMTLDLSQLPADDDPLDDWSDEPDPEEVAGIVERSYGLADGAVELGHRRLARARDGVRRTGRRPPGCVPHDGPGGSRRRASSWSARSPRRAAAGSRAASSCARCTTHASAGSTVSSLQSSRLGYPVYRRLGYVELCRLGMWERSR